MDQRLIYFLSAQLSLQGEVMAAAKGRYTESVSALKTDSTLGNYAQVLLGVQGILTSAAMVSKILWHNRQRNALRKELGIRPEHEVVKNHDARDALEHIDVRIERYFKGNPPLAPGDPELFWRHRGATRDPRNYIGAVFHEANIFVILGSSVEFMKLPDAVAEVAQLARKWIDDRDLPPYAQMMV